MDTARRDIMAPDNEPTDEELALVMSEARDAVARRKARSDEWMRQQLKAAVREAFARDGKAPPR